MTDDYVFVRVNSHRAAERLYRLLGVDHLDWHYTWETGGKIAKIPADRLADARQIPSITRYGGKSEPRPCWSIMGKRQT